MVKIWTLILTGMFCVVAQDNLQQRLLEAKNKVFPALVHIEPVKEIFSSGKRVKVQVTGSGVIFSPDGLVLTNNHVAEKARQVRCTLANRVEVPAEVVGLDALTDLAVLKLDLSKTEYDSVPYVALGNSDNLEVGEFVMALGSPLGLSRSLSMGVVSSIDRYFEDSGEMVSPFNLWIQTDAAINPGNSGGPLVNLKGEVIGINARAIFFGENLGFAIPINTAKVVIEQILEYGEVERSWIGIEWQEIKEYRYYKNDLRLEGVLIAYIEEGSPAEQAGLKAGDLVYQINDQPVNAIYREELPKVRKLIAEIPVNSSIQITYMRDDKKQESIFRTELRGKFEGTEFECTGWDLSVKELTPRIIKNLNLKEKEGVLVSGVRLGGLAHEAEVFRGSVITHIDTHKIKNLEHFKDLFTRMEKLPPQGRMLQLIYRSATTFALLKEK
jgi:serine protease Do